MTLGRNMEFRPLFLRCLTSSFTSKKRDGNPYINMALKRIGNPYNGLENRIRTP